MAASLLSAGVVIGLILLLAPGVAASTRSSGGQLLVVSLPGLAVVVGLVGASWSR
jgi:hypothetical protein